MKHSAPRAEPKAGQAADAPGRLLQMFPLHLPCAGKFPVPPAPVTLCSASAAAFGAEGSVPKWGQETPSTVLFNCLTLEAHAGLWPPL